MSTLVIMLYRTGNIDIASTIKTTARQEILAIDCPTGSACDLVSRGVWTLASLELAIAVEMATARTGKVQVML
jgi:hypothetical protein